MRARKKESPIPSGDVSYNPGDIVFAVDASDHVTYWNEEAARTFGYAPAEILGAPLNKVCMRADPGAGSSRVSTRAIMAGRGFAGGLECRHRDGTTLALYMYAAPTRDDRGAANGVVFVARDVTPFRRAEQAVRVSEEKYRLLIDSSSDFVIVAEPDGRIVEANRAVSQTLGYEPGELVGRSVASLTASGDRPAVDRALADARSRRSARMVVGFRTSDDRPVMVEVNMSVLETGDVPRALIIGRDVTDRLRAEQAVRDSEEKYREMFAAVGDGVFLETLDGRILDVNQSACDLLGYGREELLRKHVADLLPEESRPWLPQITEAVVKRGGFRGEGVNLRRDGSELPVEVACSLLVLGNERLVLTLVRDITERRRAEKALRRSEASFRALADNASDGIIIAVEGGRHVYANPRAAGLTGYSQDELVGIGLDGLAHPDELPGLRKRLEQRLAGGDTQQQYETRVVRKDGTVVPVEVSGARTTWRDRPATLLVFRDIAERKRAEEALRESEEKYRNVVERANDGICIVKDAVIKYANPSLARLMGQSAAAAVGAPFLEYVHPERRAEITERYEKRMTGKPVPQVYETTLRDKRGNRIDVELNAGLIPYQGGTADLVFIRDITERKRGEERLRFLLQSVPNAVLYQTGGGVEYVSPNVGDLLGYPAAALVAERGLFPSLIHPDDRPAVDGEFQAWLAAGAGGVHEKEFRVRRKDGQYIWLLDRTRLAFRADDGRRSTLGVLVDITARKEAERALRDSERSYRDSLDALWSAVHVVDRDLRILLFNAAFRKWNEALGLDTDVIGRSLFDVFPFLPARVREEYERVLATGETVVTEETTTVGGRKLITDTSKTPIIENGEVVRILTVIRDITERRWAEEAVREGQRALATLMSNLPGMAYRCRPDDSRTMEFVSEGCLELTGYYPEDVTTGGTVAYVTLIEPVDRPLVLGEIRAAIADREAFELTYRIRTRSGAVKWVSEQGQGVFAEDGTLVALEGYVADITRRRAAEEALTASEARYRRLFDLLPDGVAVHQAGRLVAVNAAGARLLGYRGPGEMLGVPVLDFVHPDDREKVVRRIRRVVEDGLGSESAEERFRRRDGSFVDVEVADAPLVWHGKPAVLVVVRDITERKQHVRELQTTASQMRVLFDRSPYPLCAESDGAVVFANQAFARLYGYDTPAPLAGRRFLELVAAPDRDRVASYLAARAEGRDTPVVYRFQAERRDGSRLLVENTASPYRLGGLDHVINTQLPVEERR